MHGTLLEARKRWPGPPNINEVKPRDIVSYFKVSFCFYSTHSGMKTKSFINLVGLDIEKKSVSEALSLLINRSSPKLHSSPFKTFYF